MLDLSFLRKISKGDSKKMKRYISLYLEVTPGTFQEMEKNIAERDWEQLRINAHSLKPQADFMGLADLKEHLMGIEEAVQSSKIQAIDALFTAAQSRHLEAMDFLEKALSDLSAQ
ncbi:MAG: hypothetical protein GC205_01375 [Bacteroidetes bacterium]|nr:hypothetical protein [Bacteroidota bacterium]